MRLHPRLISTGFAMALILVAVLPSSATVLPNLVPWGGLPLLNSPQSISVNNLMPSTPSLMPQTVPIPVTVPSIQPADNELEFVGSPEVNSFSPFSLGLVSPSIYQVSPIYGVSPLTLPSPIPLLYTGPPDAPYIPGDPPPMLSGTTPSEPVNDLFTAGDPETPDITSDFNNSTISFGPALAVPEPRLASVMAVAVALALGILVARRRKKEAYPKPPACSAN